MYRIGEDRDKVLEVLADYWEVLGMSVVNWEELVSDQEGEVGIDLEEFEEKAVGPCRWHKWW